MAKRIDLDSYVLHDLYYSKNMSAKEIADFFAVNKSTVLRNMKRYAFDRRAGGPAWNKGENSNTSKFVKKQADKMIGNQNSLTNGLGVAKRLSPKIRQEIGVCKECGTKDGLVLHHEDRNHANNELENLTVLCASCHIKEHAIEDNYGAKFWNWTILEDEIAEIKPVGTEMTYDLTMGTWSNFVANKFIVHNCGKHAGAVIITKNPVTDSVPVMRSPGGDDQGFSLQTQWDKKQLESVNIHKYDILGLSTLTVLNKLEQATGIVCTDIPHDDPKTWMFLKKATNMEGVFQLSSPEMKGWCRKVIPEWTKDATGLIDHLSDINAINRPAVLDAGLGKQYIKNRDKGSYDLDFDYPFIREVLDETNGVILYQEQVLYLAKSIAGFSLGKGDLLRRNLENMGTAGKNTEKVIKENKQFRKEFIEGCVALHGFSNKVADGLFLWLSDSSGYGFNKAHSWTYSLIGYWCIDGEAGVLLENGATKKLKNIRVGDRVMSVDEDTGTLVKNIVVHQQKMGTKKTYKVTTKSGKVLVLTGDHKILTKHGYKKLDQLVIGDTVKTLN